MTDKEKSCYSMMYELIAERAADYKTSAALQADVWEDRIPETQPLLLRCSLPDRLSDKIPDYHPGEIHNDKVKMLLNGMKGMLHAVTAKSHAVPSIRANMGCGIVPSLFPGILPLLFEDGKMPWVKTHLDAVTIRKLREKDITLTDEFKTALEHMAYIAERIDGTGAYVYPLDMQGPFDTAHIVRGDGIFYDMYDDPELTHHLLDLSCYAIELGMTECLKLIPGSDITIAHYNDMAFPRSMGGIKLSEDTSTLLSPDQIDEFVMPYTRRALDRFGGGYIHYCGRNDHLLKRALETTNAHCVNLGNPDHHDMDDFLNKHSASGKIYYGSISKPNGEDVSAYFRRLKKAASVGGKCRLLLSYYTEYDNIGAVTDAWLSV